MGSGQNGRQRVRVLLLAEAANPEWVSVPLVGWCHAEALRRHADVHLVTQVRNRDAIVRQGWREGRDFTAIDSEAVARVMWQLASRVRGGEDRGWTTLTALSWPSYWYFEWLVWQRFGDRIRRGDWDVVHRVTPVSPALPSPIAARVRRAGVPFVVGPLNGGVPWPAGFAHLRRREGEWLSHLRAASRWLPGAGRMRRHASAMVIASRITMGEVPRAHRARCVHLPENAIDLDRYPPRPQAPPGGPLRAVFLGRLVPLKCVDVLVEAAAPLCREGRLRVDILGDGPERAALQARIDALGVGDAVRLVGWVPHTEVPERLAEQDLFVFPSIREFGGGAVLEAMAAGLAPLVVDYGGPGELVTAETGYRIPLGSRDALVGQLHAALAHATAHPGEVAERGRRARHRVERLFTWDAKAQQMLRIYAWAAGHGDRPDFGVLDEQRLDPQGARAAAGWGAAR
jgi:glycosyltransferase involved in cell wall biosynthesis